MKSNVALAAKRALFLNKKNPRKFFYCLQLIFSKTESSPPTVFFFYILAVNFCDNE